MISWLVFVILYLLSVLAGAVFIPRTTLLRYVQCPKPWYFWAAQVFSHGVWIVAVVQSWLAPTSFSLSIWMLGVALLATGSALQVWAMRVNPYFLPFMIAPARVVREGPYRWLRRPAYLGLAYAHYGTFLLLAQTWAIIPLGLYICLLAWRARFESRFLASL